MALSVVKYRFLPRLTSIAWFAEQLHAAARSSWHPPGRRLPSIVIQLLRPEVFLIEIFFNYLFP